MEVSAATVMPLFLGLIGLAPMLLLAGLILVWKRWFRNRHRRSPLTSDLSRPAGYGLLERIEELNLDLDGYLFGMSFVTPYFVTWYLYESLTRPEQMSSLRLALVGGSLALILAYLLWKGLQLVIRRQKYREALDGELATAQLLEPVIAGGGRLLHDIQAPGFNIDHVVIAPGGVFAIETKHRLKSTQGKGLDQAKVTFDGQALRFPDWTETKPVEQARAQARWLSERLTRSTGLEVVARPVIALPGWFVQNTTRSDVIAINPKGCQFMLKSRTGEAPLTPDAIQRISFQVGQLCRMPEPGGASGPGPTN